MNIKQAQTDKQFSVLLPCFIPHRLIMDLFDAAYFLWRSSINYDGVTVPCKNEKTWILLPYKRVLNLNTIFMLQPNCAIFVNLLAHL